MYKIRAVEKRLLIKMKMMNGLNYKEAKESVENEVSQMATIQTSQAKVRKKEYSKKYRAKKQVEKMKQNIRDDLNGRV